jgi:biopolymer transport protein ExbB
MNMLNLIKSGGPVMLVLFLLSIFSLMLVLLKFIEFYRLRLKEKIVAEELEEEIKKSDIKTVTANLRNHPSPIAKIAATTLEVCATRRGDGNDFERVLELYASEQIRKLERGLSTISLTAHLSPLLGLLGTVMGMISAFRVLEKAGLQADPSLLAGGIWEALLTTAFGLIIAIPLLAAFHYFEGIISGVAHRMQILSSELVWRLDNIDSK